MINPKRELHWVKIPLLAFALSLIITLLFGASTVSAYSGGSGTAASPYKISNADDLNSMRDGGSNTNLYFELTNDIDLSSYSNWVPLPQFLGNLDGNGYTIKNLKINRPTMSQVGLFQSIHNNTTNGIRGNVKNLRIEDADIRGGTYTGVLAGRIYGYNNTQFNGYATVSNVHVSGDVINTTGQYVGGVTGQSLSHVKWDNVTSDVDIDVDVTSQTTYYIGGITGQAQYNLMEDVESYGSIDIRKTSTGYVRYVGGLSGHTTNSTFFDSVNHGSVSVYSNSSNNNVYEIGGINGYITNSSMENVVNNGDVDVEHNHTSYTVHNIGGINGNAYNNYNNYFSGYRTLKATQNNKTGMFKIMNTGKVNVKSNNNAYQIGGIDGYTYRQHMESISNYGEVHVDARTSAYNIGGVNGYNNMYSGSYRHYYLENYGDINIKNRTVNQYIQYIGGISGQDSRYNSAQYRYHVNQHANITIDNYSNNYTRYIGRLTGQGYSSVYYYNFLATGDIKLTNGYANNYIGGITGRNGFYYDGYSGPGEMVDSSRGKDSSALYQISGSATVSNVLVYTGLNGATNYSNGTYNNPKYLSSYPHLSGTYWRNLNNVTYPHLKNTLEEVHLTNPDYAETQEAFVELDWEGKHPNQNRTKTLKMYLEKKEDGQDEWTMIQNGKTFTTTGSSYSYPIPKGTPGNTEFRYQIELASSDGDYSPSQRKHIKYVNNTPTITTTFNDGQRELTVSLDSRVMEFTVNDVVDPDDFNYVKLFADIEELSGSAKQLESDYDAPVNWNSKNYKLKLNPNFSPLENNYDLQVVHASDETKVVATLVKDRPMQKATDANPEKFTFRVYALDYQIQDDSRLTPDNLVDFKTIEVIVDTRNFLPLVTDAEDDVNNRLMSANQGFNRIEFSGKITDFDPEDDIEVFYTVKAEDALVDGVYEVNPNEDVFVASFDADGVDGVQGESFSAIYTVSGGLVNDDYVILVYGVDHRGGIGDPHIIPFTVDRSDPEIRFFAEHNNNTLSTAERQIVAKDSILKMYFSAYNYTTFEYAGYLVRDTHQNISGEYEDLNIRGAFTNDVESQFIGVDLTDERFTKGDMLVFKFRAISSTGAQVERDVRIYIGDNTHTLDVVEDAKVPADLLTE